MARHQPIRTKFHTALDLLEAGEIYLKAPAGEEAVHAGKIAGFDAEELRRVMALLGRKAPKFVLDQEVVSLVVQSDAAVKSISAMQEAGVLHLPFPEMVVETRWGDTDYITTMSELTDVVGQFALTEFAVASDQDGDYLVIPPAVTVASWLAGEAKVTLEGFGAPWFQQDTPFLVDHSSRVGVRMVSRAVPMLFAALILMNTSGIEKVVVEPTGLNRQRRASGRREIPTHHIIRIGHVYSREGVATKAPEGDKPGRRRMPIHLRRAHNRRVRFGKGREQVRLEHIPAVLVNYRPDDSAVYEAPVYKVRM